MNALCSLILSSFEFQKLGIHVLELKKIVELYKFNYVSHIQLNSPMANNNVSTVISGSNLGGITAGQINISEGKSCTLCELGVD